MLRQELRVTGRTCSLSETCRDCRWRVPQNLVYTEITCGQYHSLQMTHRAGIVITQPSLDMGGRNHVASPTLRAFGDRVIRATVAAFKNPYTHKMKHLTPGISRAPAQRA